MKRSLTLATLCAACLLVLTIPMAQAADSGPPQMSVDELKARLNLTPEQQAKIQPYADTRKAKFQEAHSKMSSATSKHDKRAAMKEAKQAQDEFVRNVEPILTAEQQAEWKKMRAEAHDKMKQAWHERQQP